MDAEKAIANQQWAMNGRTWWHSSLVYASPRETFRKQIEDLRHLPISIASKYPYQLYIVHSLLYMSTVSQHLPIPLCTWANFSLFLCYLFITSRLTLGHKQQLTLLPQLSIFFYKIRRSIQATVVQKLATTAWEEVIPLFTDDCSKYHVRSSSPETSPSCTWALLPSALMLQLTSHYGRPSGQRYQLDKECHFH